MPPPSKFKKKLRAQAALAQWASAQGLQVHGLQKNILDAMASINILTIFLLSGNGSTT